MLAERLARWTAVVVGVVLLTGAVKWASSTEPFAWSILAGIFAWSIAAVLSVRVRSALVACAFIATVLIVEFGWAAAIPFIMTAAAFGVRLPFVAALAAVLGALGLAWLGMELRPGVQPPNHCMAISELLFATGNTFALAAAIRSALAAQARVQAMAEKLYAANDMLRSDLQATELLAAAQERARIARELHDNLGHSLATAHVHVQLARKHLRGDTTKLEEAVEQSMTSTRQAMHELRHAVAILHDSGNDQPLTDKIRGLLRRIPNAVLEHGFDLVGDPRRLVPAKEFVLYRTLQESITNVAKHAHARRIDVRLEFGPQARVRLDIRDDGVGTNVVRMGFGLRGIQERLATVGGHLEIHSTQGSGFRLIATLEAA